MKKKKDNFVNFNCSYSRPNLPRKYFMMTAAVYLKTTNSVPISVGYLEKLYSVTNNCKICIWQCIKFDFCMHLYDVKKERTNQHTNKNYCLFIITAINGKKLWPETLNECSKVQWNGEQYVTLIKFMNFKRMC